MAGMVGLDMGAPSCNGAQHFTLLSDTPKPMSGGMTGSTKSGASSKKQSWIVASEDLYRIETNSSLLNLNMITCEKLAYTSLDK